MANFNLNKVILGGRLTAKPELKITPTGKSVTSFSVAVNRRMQKDETDFINVVAWGKTAELASNYFDRASSICIVGNIQTRSWTDNGGIKHYATEVVADEIYFVDSRAEVSLRPQASATATEPSVGEDTPPKFEEITGDDELPF